MTKEEYVKALKKYYEDNKLKEADSYGEGYTDGLAEALDYATGLTEELDESSVQKTSNVEIRNNLSYAGYADLAYNERVINGIEAVLIQLGYEVEADEVH